MVKLQYCPQQNDTVDKIRNNVLMYVIKESKGERRKRTQTCQKKRYAQRASIQNKINKEEKKKQKWWKKVGWKQWKHRVDLREK